MHVLISYKINIALVWKKKADVLEAPPQGDELFCGYIIGSKD